MYPGETLRNAVVLHDQLPSIVGAHRRARRQLSKCWFTGGIVYYEGVGIAARMYVQARSSAAKALKAAPTHVPTATPAVQHYPTLPTPNPSTTRNPDPDPNITRSPQRRANPTLPYPLLNTQHPAEPSQPHNT